MPEIIKQKIELAFGYYNSNHVDTKYSRRIDFFLFAFSRQIVVYTDDGNWHAIYSQIADLLQSTIDCLMIFIQQKLLDCFYRIFQRTACLKFRLQQI